MAKPLEAVKELIRSVAPTLAAALGGPLAGVAVGKLSQAVLGKPDGRDSEVAAALQQATDPSILFSLKKADDDFKAQMAEYGIDLAQLAAQDRANARARQVAVRDVTPNVLAYGIVGFFCLYAWFVVFHYRNLSEVEVGLASTVMGYVIGEVKSVYQYYFGSSSGSAAKSETLAQIVGGNPIPRQGV